jgi:AraC-like DNA-binding protein
LPQGYSTIERVSEKLHLTPRTLQRHLQSQGTSYSDLLKQVRLDRANYYLKSTDLSLTEIALNLGYREQSSFSSAYKSWTGTSPHQARDQDL